MDDLTKAHTIAALCGQVNDLCADLAQQHEGSRRLVMALERVRIERNTARLQLSAVRTWMAQHAKEPGCREHILELSDAMLNADKEDPNGQ